MTQNLEISTHTPLAGRDKNPASVVTGVGISTHTPLAGRDLVGDILREKTNRISIHTPLAGRDNMAVSYTHLQPEYLVGSLLNAPMEYRNSS